MEKKPELMDTTLRDGEQMEGVSFSPQDKLMIARKLFDIGINRIEVSSARAVNKDFTALQEICKYADSIGRRDSVEVLTFIDNQKSVDWVTDAGCRTVNLLAKGSRKHCEGQFGKTLEQHIEDIARVIDHAKSRGVTTVNAYLEAWSDGMDELRGLTADGTYDQNQRDNYVLDLSRALINLGVKRLMLADTRGKMFPWEVQNDIGLMRQLFPETHFDFHPHNDRGLGAANALYAIKAGVNGVHVTLNGLGERAGNCSLYEVVMNANDGLLLGLGVNESAFYELKRLVEDASKTRLSPHTPIVGMNANKQTAGVHADGDKKGDLYRLVVPPERIGKTGTEYALGKQSGIASIDMNLKQMGLEADVETRKKLTAEVRRLGEQGKLVTQEDLYFLLEDIGHEVYEIETIPPFRFEEVRPKISLHGSRRSYIRVRVYGEELEGRANGDGAFDATMKALTTVMARKGVTLPKLTDYQIRIPTSGQTDAIVETLIEWQNGTKFRTVGVDTDQFYASIKAVEKMVNLVMSGYKR